MRGQMGRLCWLTIPILLIVSLPRGTSQEGSPAPGSPLRIEVGLAKGLVSEGVEGRLLLVLGPSSIPEPRLTIGQTGLAAPPVLGRDVANFKPGDVAVFDEQVICFPIENLSRLKAGTYYVQAILMLNRELLLPNAPGNVFSRPERLQLDPARGGTFRISLTEQLPPEKLPTDGARVKYVKLESKFLSQFHGRPTYLRAGVLLPRDFETDEEKRFPLRVSIGGYGSRFHHVQAPVGRRGGLRQPGDDAPQFVQLHLDGAGPLGDPYQVNSANHGPYGDAITQELIPHVEKTFRCIGKPHARVLDGASTGGWVSLALQIFYPDFFNGAWSHCPDPVDFRAFELIDVYRHENAYVNPYGFERPARRTPDGDVIYTVRHECLLERVLGRGDRWELSGKDWGAWNATFGPRGADGRPVPLWDGVTGKIDRAAAEHWKKYDLRRILQENWATLGPKLRGKLHVHAGELDEYYLNNAVHLLKDSLARVNPPFEGRIVIAPNAGHTTFLSEADQLREMAAAVARGE